MLLWCTLICTEASECPRPLRISPRKRNGKSQELAANLLLTGGLPAAAGAATMTGSTSVEVRANCCTRFAFLSSPFFAADMMFFILVALFFARQAGTNMDPRTHEQIRLASCLAVTFFISIPLFVAEQSDDGIRPPEHLPRNRRRGMAGTPGHPALQRTLP